MAILRAKTEGGIVEGIPSSNHTISVFRGVPYAAPPVGKKRWTEPQPVEKWDGIRQAVNFAPIPFQPPRYKTNDMQRRKEIDWPMSEDCLYLNIWTPAQSTEDKLPVAVYMFGGGMRQGYSHTLAMNGEAFARRDMVYVNFNYRVNLFGYFAHPDLTKESSNATSGSYGTLDMVAALQWINRNISNFGGDPDSISIFGQSAGGDCVRSMVTTPLTKGIVKRAIMMSGSGLSYLHGGMRKTIEDGEREGLELFKSAGIVSIEEAREMDPAKVLNLFTTHFKLKIGARIVFTPLVDGYLSPESPVECIRSGHHHDIAYMIGSTSDEDGLYPLDQNPDYNAFIEATRETYGDETGDYLNAAGITDVPSLVQHNRNYIRNYMLAGSLAFCINQERIGRSRLAYQYWFNQTPPGLNGAYHGAEHPYINESFHHMDRRYTGEDYELSMRMSDTWCNFMKSGDPNSPIHPQWSPFTEQQPLAMEFGGNNDMMEIPISPFVRYLADCGLKGLKND